MSENAPFEVGDVVRNTVFGQGVIRSLLDEPARYGCLVGYAYFASVEREALITLAPDYTTLVRRADDWSPSEIEGLRRELAASRQPAEPESLAAYEARMREKGRARSGAQHRPLVIGPPVEWSTLPEHTLDTLRRHNGLCQIGALS